MEIGWNFPSNNNGEIIGIGEAGIETFKGSLFSSLAREICQNSLDARKDLTRPVRVEFALKEIRSERIPGREALQRAIRQCELFWKDNKRTEDFFRRAEEVCGADRIRVLRISDYNTTGLSGSDKLKSSPWQDLVKSSGVSNKSGESGGSFGIGKSAPFACSDLRTIFYTTLDEEGKKAYQGVAKLVSFYLSGSGGEITQGKGYYGKMSDNSAVGELMSFGEYLREETGTDVYILGFIQNEEWKEEMIKAVIEGYLISILRGDLEVSVDGVLISRRTIHRLMESYREKLPLTHNYYQVLTDDQATVIEEDFQGLGRLELRVLIRSDFRRKVLMARNNGMKVFDKQNISGTIPFAGTCVLRDKALNEYFREMENPQHNNWEPDRHSDKKEAKKMRKELFSFVKAKILEIGKTNITDEMDAIGAGIYIPDLTEKEESSEGERKESILDEVQGYSPLEKKKNISSEVGAEPLMDPEFETEIPDFGEEDARADLFGEGYPRGDKGRAGGESSGREEVGIFQKTGEKPVRRVLTVKPLKMRLFVLRRQDNTYKLSFVPEKSVDDAHIEIFLSGEQGKADIEIKNGQWEQGKSLECSGNRIRLGNLRKGKTYVLLYRTVSDEVYSMGVSLHGYQA